MKTIILPNGLTRKTTNCLTKAGIVIEQKAIAKALKTGTIYPYYWPASYGLKTRASAILALPFAICFNRQCS